MSYNDCKPGDLIFVDASAVKCIIQFDQLSYDEATIWSIPGTRAIYDNKMNMIAQEVKIFKNSTDTIRYAANICYKVMDAETGERVFLNKLAECMVDDYLKLKSIV